MAITNIYDRLGVQRLINGHHWRTALGGSVMPPEVVDAMAESAGYFVDLEGLHRSAGEYIAELTGADAGLVTAGCSAAQVLQAAACMTGTDDEKIARLPDSSGMKNKVLIQKSQRNHYDTSYQLAGATLVEVGGDEGATKAELEAAIDDDTAAVTYVWVMRFHALPLEDVIEVSHSRDVPVLLDAASELPPVENLSRFIRMGVDMVAFSGGKGIRGPQSTGILAGRGDLMRAAWDNSFFFGKDKAGIGRPMKVAKEEIIGLVRALELFVEADHESEWVDWRAKSTTIADAADALDGVKGWVHEGPIYEGPTAPTATIELAESWEGPTVEQVEERLRTGEPSIHIGVLPDQQRLWVAPVAFQGDEADVVARRMVEELTKSP